MLGTQEAWLVLWLIGPMMKTCNCAVGLLAQWLIGLVIAQVALSKPLNTSVRKTMKAKFLNKETSRRGRNFQPAQFMTALDKVGTKCAGEERFRKENSSAKKTDFLKKSKHAG